MFLEFSSILMRLDFIEDMKQMNACGWLAGWFIIQQQARSPSERWAEQWLWIEEGLRAKLHGIHFCYVLPLFDWKSIEKLSVSDSDCMWLVGWLVWSVECVKPNQENKNQIEHFCWNEFGGQQRSKWKIERTITHKPSSKNKRIFKKAFWIFFASFFLDVVLFFVIYFTIVVVVYSV